MASPLRTATKETIAQVMAAYKGTKIAQLGKGLEQYQLVEGNAGAQLERTFLYKDFKEAFSNMILISKTCQAVNYYPEIFNVYNRVEVKLFTKEEQRKVTSKDVYVALLLDEIGSKTVDEAHSASLKRVQEFL